MKKTIYFCSFLSLLLIASCSTSSSTDDVPVETVLPSITMMEIDSNSYDVSDIWNLPYDPSDITTTNVTTINSSVTSDNAVVTLVIPYSAIGSNESGSLNLILTYEY